MTSLSLLAGTTVGNFMVENSPVHFFQFYIPALVKRAGTHIETKS